MFAPGGELQCGHSSRAAWPNFASVKNPRRHAGLVGEQNTISGIVEAADCLRRIRHPANPVMRAHIASSWVDDAVAVEEGGGLGVDPDESKPEWVPIGSFDSWLKSHRSGLPISHLW